MQSQFTDYFHIITIFMKLSTLISNGSKLCTPIATVCILLTASSVQAEGIQHQPITGVGFQGSCNVENGINLRSGPSTNSNVIESTNRPLNSVQVHTTQNHSGLWSWVTVNSTDAWIKSDHLVECQGTRIATDMYYAQSREFLLEQGWQPVDGERPSYAPVGYDYLKSLGFSEVVFCSGTGLGICVLSFYNEQGDELEVSTVANNSRASGIEVYSWRITPHE
jgi:hypothetical protein